MKNRDIMFLPLNKGFFDAIFYAKSDSIGPILEAYHVDKQGLYDALLEEFLISGMEIRMANSAFDYLIDRCEEKKDLCGTLKGEIKHCILMSGIFYTNIAPQAAFTSEFKG